MTIDKETLLSIAKSYELNPLSIERIENSFVINLGNSDYRNTEKFQIKSTEIVKLNKGLSLYICCSHPHCFTMGRGLQKKSGSVLENLIETDLESIKLPFPVYQIKRGGGLTFHYPGQFILYPIINLNNKNNNLKDLVNWLLETTKNILNDSLGLEQLTKKTDPLGLWANSQKLASIGIGSNRFVTYHGLALNLINDNEMFSALTGLNPCGLNSSVYTNVEALTNQTISQNKFTHFFIEKLQNNSESVTRL